MGASITGLFAGMVVVALISQGARYRASGGWWICAVLTTLTLLLATRAIGFEPAPPPVVDGVRQYRCGLGPAIMFLGGGFFLAVGTIVASVLLGQVRRRGTAPSSR